MTTKMLVINGKPAGMKVTIATSFFQRLRGLMGQKTAYPLLLPACGSIHTFFMRCAIDVVFLDADSRVMKIERQLPPWRFSACRRAKSVLELPPGIENVWSLNIGDILAFS